MIRRLFCLVGFHRLKPIQVIDASQPDRRPRVIVTEKCEDCGLMPAFPKNPVLKGEYPWKT